MAQSSPQPFAPRRQRSVIDIGSVLSDEDDGDKKSLVRHSLSKSHHHPSFSSSPKSSPRPPKKKKSSVRSQRIREKGTDSPGQQRRRSISRNSRPTSNGGQGSSRRLAISPTSSSQSPTKSPSSTSSSRRRITTASIRHEIKNPATKFPNLDVTNGDGGRQRRAHQNQRRSSKSPRPSRSPRGLNKKEANVAGLRSIGDGPAPPPFIEDGVTGDEEGATSDRNSSNRIKQNDRQQNYHRHHHRHPKRRSSMSALPVSTSSFTGDDDNYYHEIVHLNNMRGHRFASRSLSRIVVDDDEDHNDDSRISKLEARTEPVVVDNGGGDNDDDDDEDMPPLLVRHDQEMSGVRSGKQWQILDDTPHGHALEKLSIVAGVDETGQKKHAKYDVLPDEEVSLDEADDILDDDYDDEDAEYDDSDDDDDENNHCRSSDVEEENSVKEGVKIPIADHPRDDDEMLHLSPTISQKRSLHRFSSASHQINTVNNPHEDEEHTITNVSLVSDNESGHHSFNFSVIDPGDSVSAKSQRWSVAGRRTESKERKAENRIGDIEVSLSDDEHDDIEEDDDENFTFLKGDGAERTTDLKTSRWESQKPRSTGRIGAPQRKKSIQKEADPTIPTKDRTEKKSSDVRRTKRLSRHRIPSVVHSGAGVRGQAPVSPSLTKTPSSTRQSSRQKLGEYIGCAVPFRDDEPTQHSVGASTITTNFSTTQRTQGTVSTRSLFQSSNKAGSDFLKIPERRPYDSDIEDDDCNEKDESPERNGSQIARDEVSRCADANLFILQSQEPEEIPKRERDIMEGKTFEYCPSPQASPVQTKQRRLPGFFKKMKSWKSKSRPFEE